MILCHAPEEKLVSIVLHHKDRVRIKLTETHEAFSSLNHQ